MAPRPSYEHIAEENARLRRFFTAWAIVDKGMQDFHVEQDELDEMRSALDDLRDLYDDATPS